MSARKNSPVTGVIVSSCRLAAGPDEVFAAFSDPTRLAQWWGPKGFTNTFHEFNFQPGGAWRFTMHGPDGANFEMNHRFVELIPAKRIVVRHIQTGHDFTLRMSLSAQGEGTELTWEMIFADPAEGERVRAFVVPANQQNFDRLAAHLSVTRPVVR